MNRVRPSRIQGEEEMVFGHAWLERVRQARIRMYYWQPNGHVVFTGIFLVRRDLGTRA